MNKIKGFRKAAFGVLLIAVAVTLEIVTKNGLSAIMSQFLIAIGAGFFLGNGLEHGANALKERKPQKTIDLSPVEAGLEEVKEQQAQIIQTTNIVANAIADIMNRINQAGRQANSGAPRAKV